MNQGARDANAESSRSATSSKTDQQIELLKEIRDLLKKLLSQQRLDNSG